MLTAAGCRARRARLWARLAPRPDALLISDPKHLAYLANFALSPSVFRSDDAGALLLLTPDGRTTLIADNLLEPFAAQAHVDEVLAPVWYRGAASASLRRELLVNTALEHLRGLPVRRLGIEPSSLPAGVLNELRGDVALTNLEPVLRALRRAKDDDELALLRRSIELGVAGFAAARRELLPGMTELDAFQIVQRATTTLAGEPVSLYGDFLSGPRCPEIGGPPSTRRIQAGELVLLDFSIVLRHYRGDLADTFVCAGIPTPRQQEVFSLLLEALQAGEQALKPGVSARAVWAAVHGVLERAGLGQYHPGHAGHGVGLSHPEPPYFVRESTDTVQAGDVVTLEPGVYIPGELGMRIERNYGVTATGFEVLSNQPFGLEQ